MVHKSLTFGAIGALFVTALAGQGALAQSYVSQADALDKLTSVEPECIAVASYYIPNGNCETQTYLVEFANDANQAFVDALEADSLEASLTLGSVSAFELNGFELADMARQSRVLSIAQNIEVSIAGSQSPAPWQLDRMDQQALPLDSTYNYTDAALGAGVRVYIVDTGVNSSHAEFAGRLVPGYSSIGTNTADTQDCNGHGTHVAGLAAGTTYGAAKAASIVPVRVLDCDGNGSLLGVLRGLDWVATNTNVGQAAVVNMSLGGDVNTYLDSAINSLTSQGLAFVVAAGNSGVSACNTSPARVAGAITVAASTRTDGWPLYSNSGGCVDVIAPGDAVISAWIGSSTASATLSGTSMAAGVVSGIVATQMSYGYQTPAALSTALTTNAVSGTITSVPADTPNLLVQNTIGFNAPGSSSGSAPAVIQVPQQDTTPVSIVDPITTPTPGTPGSGTDVPVTYAKPTVTILSGVATVNWVIPQMVSPLVGQTLQLISGTTMVAEYQVGATATTFVLPTLATGVVYRVQVAGLNANGIGTYSETSEPFSLTEIQLAGPDGGEFSAWIKRISDSQVKFYVKFPQLNQKIQFMAQQANGSYKQIAWTRITADRIDENGEYIGLTNGVYFVRTFTLKEGKNRLRILVDGKLYGTTKTYSR